MYRFRSVQREKTTDRRIINCKATTNILKFPKESKIYKDFQSVASTDDDKKIDQQDEAILMSPEIVTEVLTDREGEIPRMYRLQDLFLNYDQLTPEEKSRNSFRVRLQVFKVDPADLREACQVLCSKGTTSSCKDLSENVKCNGKDTKLIWQIQFLVKDSASQLNKNFYRVMLYSGVDNLGADFFGPNHEPCNLYRNGEELRFVQKTCAKLVRFNVWLDAVLERRGNYFVIKDTRLV